MNRPVLSIKQKAPLLSVKGREPLSNGASPLISNAVVTRRRRYEVSDAELRKDPAPKPPPAPAVSPAPPKPSLKKATKMPPVPVIPREERIAACLATLQATWPLLFDEAAVVLWEVGIRKKLWRGMGKKYSRTLISQTLAHWQHQHPVYLEMLKTAGNPRYGLEGTVTMTVTEDQAQRAMAMGSVTPLADLTERLVVEGLP